MAKSMNAVEDLAAVRAQFDAYAAQHPDVGVEPQTYCGRRYTENPFFSVALRCQPPFADAVTVIADFAALAIVTGASLSAHRNPDGATMSVQLLVTRRATPAEITLCEPAATSVARSGI